MLLNGYAYFATEEEQQPWPAYAARSERASEQRSLQPFVAAASIVGCRALRFAAHAAQRGAAAQGSIGHVERGFRPLVIEQLLDRKREKELPQIVPITRIDDEISKAVRASTRRIHIRAGSTAPSPRPGTIASLWKRLRAGPGGTGSLRARPGPHCRLRYGHHPFRWHAPLSRLQILAVDL